MFTTSQFSTVSPDTFLHLDTTEGQLLIQEANSVKLGDVTLQNEDFCRRLLETFLPKYMNIKSLREGKRTKMYWSYYDQEGVSGVVNEIFNYLREYPDDTVIDFLYQLGQSVSAKTMSGFSVGVSPPDSITTNRSPIQILFEDRMNWLDGELMRVLEEVPSGKSMFMFMPEFDLDLEKLPKSKQYIQVLSPEIFQHEYGKAVIHTPNLQVTEIKSEEIRRVLVAKYTEVIGELYDIHSARIALVSVTNTDTGDSWTAILPHLKSFGSAKNLPEILEQANLVNLMKNCYSHGKVAMAGDWNFPMKPVPGTLGLSDEVLSSLPFEVHESWSSWSVRMLKSVVGLGQEFDYLAKGFYLPKFNQDDVSFKERDAGIDTNSQAWTKIGRRNHLTDMVTTNWGVSWFHQPELQIYPQAKDVPKLPYVGSTPFMSDHPQVSLELNDGTIIKVFNVLADNAIGPQPFNQIPTAEFMDSYRHDLCELFHTLHSNFRYPKTEE
jgi:hypothetical protein